MSRTQPNEILERLQRAVVRRHGDTSQVEQLSWLSGGASAENWSFDVVTGPHRTKCVLRRAAGQSVIGLNRLDEARVQRIVYEQGVPTPEVLFVLTPDDELGDGFIMRWIAGETIPRKILRDERFQSVRPRMAGQCGEILHAIHAADISELSMLADRSPARYLPELEAEFRTFHLELPAFDIAFCWLADHMPPAVKPCLVHGDFRNGNFMVNEQGIACVLDWELAHLGDPLEDLGWLCVNSWRYGLRDQPVGGFGQREELYAAYEAAQGTAINRQHVRFWEVFGTLRWGLICLLQARTHLSGADRSVERATIGRRVSEVEIDLACLISETEA